MSTPRIGIDILLIVSAFFCPWWLTTLGALLALFSFESYYEIVVLGLIVDSLYNASIPQFNSIHYILTLCALFAFSASTYLKEHLWFYR